MLISKKNIFLRTYELHMMTGGIIMSNRVTALLTGAGRGAVRVSINAYIDHSSNCEIVLLSWC